jgi:hypothetical protein
MQADNPATFSADQQAREIAILLAVGLRRLLSQRKGDVRCPAEEPKKSQESAVTGLEVQGETRLSGQSG